MGDCPHKKRFQSNGSFAFRALGAPSKWEHEDPLLTGCPTLRAKPTVVVHACGSLALFFFYYEAPLIRFRFANQ